MKVRVMPITHVSASKQAGPDLSAQTARQLLQALQVAQIELAMQSEKLRRAQAGCGTVKAPALIPEATLTAVTLSLVARGDPIERPLYRLIRPAHQHVFHRMRQQLLLSGETQACEWQVLQHVGAQAWVHLAATPALDDDGKSTMRIVLAGLSERTPRQANYQTEEEFSEDLLETVREPLLILDSTLRLVAANCNFYRALHRLPAQVIGKPIDELGNGQWKVPELRTALEGITGGQPMNSPRGPRPGSPMPPGPDIFRCRQANKPERCND